MNPPLPPADEALRIAGLNLRSLFDQFPFAVQVYAPDGRVLYSNAMFAQLWGYSEEERQPDYVVFESPQLNELGLMPFIRRGFGGETVALPPTRYTAVEMPTLPGGRTRWVRSFIYPIKDEVRAIRAVVVIHIDITEREETQQTLEQRVEERTRELSTLLGVARNVASTLDLNALLGVILEQLKAVADYSGYTIAVAEGEGYRILDDRGGIAPDHPNQELIGRFWPLRKAGAIWQAIHRRESVIIEDVHGESLYARAWRTANAPILDSPAIRHVRSWLAVPLEINDRVIGLISISKDEPGFYSEYHARLARAVATHVAAAIENARLYEREHRTAEELGTLLEVSRTATATLELQPLLGLVLDQIKLVLDYTSAAVLIREDEDLRAVEYRGPLPREVVLARPVVMEATAENDAAFRRGEPVTVADVWDESEAARLYRSQMGEQYLRTTASYLRCLLIAPLMLKGELVGGLVVTHQTPGYYTRHHARLVQAIANQVAGAIENARLYEQQRRTAQELASLLEVSRAVSSTLDLNALLGVIVDQIKVVADYDGATVLLVEGDAMHTIYRRVPREIEPADPGVRVLPFSRMGELFPYVLRREAAIIGDVRGDEPLALTYRRMMGGDPATIPYVSYVRSWLAVPLALQDRLIGVLVLGHSTPGYYKPRHAELVTAIASQVAGAIENARLYGEAQKLAALEERQRLARELHDSVSQVLFSIGLGARTTRTLLERGNPERALSSVDYIVNLAEMGTAEMRALLFELRPESLAQEGLVAAITKQGAALRARHGVAVDTSLCDEPAVPLEIKEAVYRIAQEATHNTVKHARAAQIEIRLACDTQAISLDVRDDGQGFDPGGDFPGHLGLKSMLERVERFGGTLTIESVPGAGTAIHVRIPLPVGA